MRDMTKAGDSNAAARQRHWLVIAVAGVLAATIAGCETTQQTADIETWREKHTGRMDDLETRLSALEQKYDDAENDRQKLRSELSELVQLEQQRKEDFKFLKREIEDAQVKLVAELKKRTDANLKQAHQEYQEIASNMISDGNVLREDFRELEDDFVKVKDGLKVHKTDVTARCNELERQYEAQLADVAKSYRNFLSTLKEHYATCKDDLSNCRTKVISANEDIAEALVEVAEKLSTSRTKFEDSLDALGQMIDNAGASVQQEANRLPNPETATAERE